MMPQVQKAARVQYLAGVQRDAAGQQLGSALEGAGSHQTLAAAVEVALH